MRGILSSKLVPHLAFADVTLAPFARAPSARSAPIEPLAARAQVRSTRHAPRAHSPPPAFPGAGLLSNREKLLALALNLLLGALSTFEYVKVAYDKCFGEFPKWHHEHMTNQAVAPLQYRVLSYLIPEMIHRLGVPIATAYVVERGVFLVAAGYVFHFFCRNWLGVVDTIFASVTLMFFYTLSVLPHIQPSEEVNLLAFALGLSFIRGERFSLLVWTIAIAAFNKETVGFLIPFYFAWEWRLRGVSRGLVGRTAALTAALGIVYVGIRLVLGADRPYLGGVWQLGHNLTFIAGDPFLGLVFVIPSIGPAAWILLRHRRVDPFFVAFLPALGLFVLGHLAISRVDEFRTYTPLALMTIPACIVLLRESEPLRLRWWPPRRR